jgi:hypothetical protein
MRSTNSISKRIGKRAWLATLMATALVASAVALMPTGAAEAHDDVRIVATNCAAETPVNEYITIGNHGTEAVDLSGWDVHKDNRAWFNWADELHNVVLEPGATLNLRTGEGENTEDDIYKGWQRFAWDREGDIVFLRNPADEIVDTMDCVDPARDTPAPSPTEVSPGEVPTPEEDLEDPTQAICVENTTVEPLTNATNVVTWDHVDDAEEYHVHEVVDGEVGDIIALLDPGTNVFHHENLEVGETYHYAVAADWHPDEACDVVSATAIPFFPGLAGAVAAALGALGVALVVARRNR